MPYRRRRTRTKGEKIVIAVSLGVVAVVALVVVTFLVVGPEFFGTVPEVVNPTAPNALAPQGQRPPAPILRPRAPPKQQNQ
jgi:hypothetical protein